MGILESKPSSPLAFQFPPNSKRSVRVSTGDSWDSIADLHGMDVWSLIEFNFPVVKQARSFETKCRQVNWMMRTHLGSKESNDGKNYRFDSGDNPGRVYLPSTPGTDPLDVKTNVWAICPVGKPSNTRVEFELVNGTTKQAHRLVIRGIGKSNSTISPLTLNYYRLYDVKTAISFRDFDRRWASIEPQYPSSHRLKISLPGGSVTKDNSWYGCLWGKDPANPFKKKVFLGVAIIGRTHLVVGDGNPSKPLTWG